MTHQNGRLPSGTAGSDPLFIIGTGRCGSTLFHDLLTRHPQVSFMTAMANRHPAQPGYNRAAVACMDIPFASSLARRKWFPVEAYNFWDRHYRGFSRPCRDLTAADAFPITVQRLRTAAAAFAASYRPRLIYKITGWPRIGFLQAVFPNARFISVIRDGRATANSLLQVHFWDGWHGPHKWAWGPLTPERQERWLRHERSFVALAALQWEVLMESYDRARAAMPDPGRLLEIRYEDLCRDPQHWMRKATEFAELDYSSRFERSCGNVRLRDNNDKWQRDLTPEQQFVLTDCLRESLAYWGYEAAAQASRRVA